MEPYSFSVRVEADRNVMYITQSGKPTAEDFRRLKARFVEELDKLEPGFAIINDQRTLEPFDEDAMVVASELVTITNERGASKVIRILPAHLVSKVQLSRALVTGGSTYVSIPVATPEQAEQALIDY
jgi:hypothetical protein